MIHLGVQYYRPPFPDRKHWREDLRRIADSGLNTVQLWAVWAWIEPAPGEWVFNDYDELIELSREAGLEVVLSSIAAIHPYWIHREVPDSEMVTNMGQKIVSSNRCECHFGLTPGGCIDHPEVLERMKAFLTVLVERYRGIDHLAGWDIWNELRWSEHADGLVCFCPHTIERFRNWLSDTHGGLDGLNEAWSRRYRSWEDVLPGRVPERPYTEMMAFQHFLTCRAVEHGSARYDIVKTLDPGHPATLHDCMPTAFHGGDAYPVGTALNRGNDWAYAEKVDGIGCSSFPVWRGTDDAEYIAGIDFLRSAAGGKRIWLSEVQGGRAATGFALHHPVEPEQQQRWIWSGIGNGADTVLFWCWRDEVFGRETAGFGMAGSDGLAEGRLAAMRRTGAILKEHAGILGSYSIDTPRVGILFSPQSYYLSWAQDGHARPAMNAVKGYARACIRKNIPYRLEEEDRLDEIEKLKLLFMPRTLVLDERQAELIGGFVKKGGTLLCESECGAFGRNGIYRYPEDRFLSDFAGLEEAGRYSLESEVLPVAIDGETLDLAVNQWLTPFRAEKGNVWAHYRDGALILDVSVGEGRIIACGAYFGDAYWDLAGRSAPENGPGPEKTQVVSHPAGDAPRNFERFVELVAQKAGVIPPVTVVNVPASKSRAPEEKLVHVKLGRSETPGGGSRRIVFVFCEDESMSAVLRFAGGIFPEDGELTDLITGNPLPADRTFEGLEVAVPPSEWGVTVIAG